MKNKYLWYTDTHLNKANPITKYKFISHIRRENPKGIFITGDISNGIFTPLDLRILATWIKCPIYFILGNHDYHFSSFDNTHQKIRQICKEHSNLVWLTESDTISLNDEVALIGVEGWYDASTGNTSYLKITPDWILIKDLKKLSNMNDRIQAFQQLANKSSQLIENKLQSALDQGYKTIYILTHMPPWKEATRDVGTILENFWMPYNVNLRLGKVIEKIMKDRNNRNVIVLAGHIHDQISMRISRNIFCNVKINGLLSEQIYV